MTGLYDSQGVLRFSGRDHADCLAYAELFALAPESFCLEPLLPLESLGRDERAVSLVLA